jgi:hypothetical protein
MEKILLALTGGSTGTKFESCGLVGDGFPTVPLAATPAVLAIIEAVGTDNFGELWEHVDGTFPPAGGLWVLECELVDDDDGDTSDDDEDMMEIGRHLRPILWRAPTTEELAALLERQRIRASGGNPDSSRLIGLCTQEQDAEWVFQGGIV